MKKKITIGEGAYRGTDGAAIQRAIDDLGPGGGCVHLPPGVYQLFDAIHLRSHVEITGEKGTVLKKVPSVSSKISHLLGFGHFEFMVEEPEKFRPGMGVLLSDSNSFGFYTTAATIVEQRGEVFFVDKRFAHDYNPAAGGNVTTVHALISGIDVEDVRVAGLTLDGNTEEKVTLNGCRGGGIFLLNVHGAEMENVEVVNFNGDAVSFQQCTDVLVANCHIHRNNGSGLHPGSGSVRYIMRNNRVENNTGCGVFYCLRTTHSICEGNVIARNGREGISVGERDTDHLIRENMISGNGDAGILMREPLRQSGDRVLLQSNVLKGNNVNGEAAEIFIYGGLADVHFADNRIEPVGGTVVKVTGDCERIHLWGNTVNGADLELNDVEGKFAGIVLTPPEEDLKVGPAAVEAHTARHLGIGAMRPNPFSP